MLKPLLKVAGLSLALLLAGCGEQILETVMFLPAKRLAADATPCRYLEKAGKSCENTEFEEIFFPSLDRQTMLQALYFPNPDSDKVIVYFHGNGQHLYTRVPACIKLSETANVFILSYRGYGKSEGKPSEAGLYEDAAATLEYVQEELKFEDDDIYLYGRSLGAAIAVDVAQQQNYAGLILVSPFLSGVAMAEEAFLGWVPGLGQPFHSIGKIGNIASPVLFIHGTDDKTVPLKQGEALYKAYPSQDKTFKKIKGGDHNQICRDDKDECLGWVREFVARDEKRQPETDLKEAANQSGI